MVIVVTLLSFQDPIGNWAPYAVYNPQLWHWPETWPLFSLSPTIEPFLSVGYAFFFIGPYFIANNVLRRIQAKKPVTSFAWRHPLWSLAGIILVVGFLIDAMLEMFLVRTQMYTYSQVIPWGSLFAGTPNQFPLVWESTTICLVMIPAGVLLYRDDTGRTQAEKLAQKIRGYRQTPRSGHLHNDVRHHQRRQPDLHRRVRHRSGSEAGDVGGLPLPLSGSEGLRPERLLRASRPTRSLLRWDLVGMAEPATRRPSQRDTAAQGGRCKDDHD